MSARDGLVVVVPDGFDPLRIPGVIEAKRDWIRRSEDRLKEQTQFLQRPASDILPDRILLRSIGQEWAVIYRGTQAATVTTAERAGQLLLVYGNVEDHEAVRDSLRRWLSRKTHEHLGPRVQQLASDRGLSVARVVVKSQRTRWASCSHRRTISLNLRLMFLPERLVRYVLVHELAHTVEMNHSRAFWGLLGSLEPNYSSLDADLRAAWRLVPEWVWPRGAGIGEVLARRESHI